MSIIIPMEQITILDGAIMINKITPKAKFRYALYLERCRLCKHTISKGSLMVSGASLHPISGYIGGSFHPSCWIVLNDTSQNRRMLKMADSKDKGLSPAKLENIGNKVGLDKLAEYSVEDVLNSEMVILSVKSKKTSFGTGVVMTCEREGTEFTVFTFSKVLIDQLKQVYDKLPMKGTVYKVGRYYTFQKPEPKDLPDGAQDEEELPF